MLVMSRKVDEVICIDGGRIKVMVTYIGDGVVKLGVEAPRDVAVHRAEVQDRIDRGEKKQTDDR